MAVLSFSPEVDSPASLGNNERVNVVMATLLSLYAEKSIYRIGSLTCQLSNNFAGTNGGYIIFIVANKWHNEITMFDIVVVLAKSVVERNARVYYSDETIIYNPVSGFKQAAITLW